MCCGGQSGSSPLPNTFSCTVLLGGSLPPLDICRFWWTKMAASFPSGRGTYSFKASRGTGSCQRRCWILQPTVDLDSAVSQPYQRERKHINALSILAILFGFNVKNRSRSSSDLTFPSFVYVFQPTERGGGLMNWSLSSVLQRSQHILPCWIWKSYRSLTSKPTFLWISPCLFYWTVQC